MATKWLLVVLSLFIIIAPKFSFSLSFKASLNKGSYLSVEKPDQVLVSPNKIFVAGFYKVGYNAYCFAIWFNDPSCPPNCSIVWMANRDNPVNGRKSKLYLLKTGNLVLTDAGHFTVWSTDTESSLPLVSLRLLDTGNLVLGFETGPVLWQSFDSPTDTLLPLQEFNRYSMLVSWRSKSNFSSGFYKMSFDEHNVLVLFYDGPNASSSFWPVDHSLLPRDMGRTTYNSRTAVLNELGYFVSSDNFSFKSSDYGVKLQRRLTLDFDGNLRLYSRESGRGSNWVVSWQAVNDSCKIHGSCGSNSVCSYPNRATKTCSCLPGFTRKNETDWSVGCEPEFNFTCVDGQVGVDDVTYIRFPHVESNGYDIAFLLNHTLEECMDYCSKRCDCKGFQFKWNRNGMPENIPYCFPKSQLLNGYRTPDFRGVLHLKVPKSRPSNSRIVQIQEKSIQCPTQMPNQHLHRIYGKKEESPAFNFLIWFVVTVGIVESVGMISLWSFVVVKTQKIKAADEGFMLAETGFKRFSYAELKKATNNFKEEIGRGGSGVVYKGRLSNGRVAAIKRLYQSEHGEYEFLKEASMIGKINHMHLIEQWGYCAERKHRLLVYEYMENGSLAHNLSSNLLDWKQRFQIAVGTAKGLAYLHEECLEWILHCDLKPENILLDCEYQPKVSDFGLSKLFNRGDFKGSNISRIRGTRGYMAPEWVYGLPITAMVDVYSYGVVVLQMLTGRDPIGVRSPDTEGVSDEIGLVNWVREQRNVGAIKGSWISRILDPTIATNCDMNKIELLVEVALQCVEEDMNGRPSMSQVAEMLQSLVL